MPKMIFVRLPFTDLDASMTSQVHRLRTTRISPTIRRRAWLERGDHSCCIGTPMAQMHQRPLPPVTSAK